MFPSRKIDIGLFVAKYEKYSAVPVDMCTKTFLVTIISGSTKRITGFRFYPYSDTEHHKLMKLHEFDVA